MTSVEGCEVKACLRFPFLHFLIELWLPKQKIRISVLQKLRFNKKKVTTAAFFLFFVFWFLLSEAATYLTYVDARKLWKFNILFNFFFLVFYYQNWRKAGNSVNMVVSVSFCFLGFHGPKILQSLESINFLSLVVSAEERC